MTHPTLTRPIVRGHFAQAPFQHKQITIEEACGLARTFLAWADSRRPLTTIQTQAVSRLDRELSVMKLSGAIKDFRLGEFTDNEIEVFMVIPDANYFSAHTLPLHKRLDDALNDLDIYANVDMESDLICGDIAATR